MTVDIPTKKLKNGFEMPVFGFGTWGIGGGQAPDTSNDQAELAALRRAIDLGITHFDTAEMYGSGHAEELLGQVIGNVERESLFLTSKVLSEHAAYEETLAACRRSLERLGTDYLDLYLLHWPSDSVPLPETIRALNKLVADGLVRHIGISNFGSFGLAEAQAASQLPIVNDQVEYNLAQQDPRTSGLVDYCVEHDVLLTAWRPVRETSQATTHVMDMMTKKYKASPAQISIAWLIAQPNVVTIAKMASQEHLTENLEALKLQIEPDDLKRLSEEF